MRIVLVVNALWNIITYRKNLVQGLIEAGYEVYIVAPKDENCLQEVKALGCVYLELEIARHSVNIFQELRTMWHLARLVKSIKPKYMLTFTMKPNIYGSLIGRIFSVSTIANVTGLGAIKSASVVKRSLYVFLISKTLKYCQHIFVQNQYDRHFLLHVRGISSNQCTTLPGSGIDLSDYNYQGILEQNQRTFLFAGRLLKSKGILEYCEVASEFTDRKGLNFLVAGAHEPSNPDSIEISKIHDFNDEGTINFLGFQSDVKQLLQGVTFVVLPSTYGEGVPRILLEAGATGKIVITTQSPGCADAVEDGTTGFYAERSKESLYGVIKQILELDTGALEEISLAARKKMEHEFDVKLVVANYLRQIEG